MCVESGYKTLSSSTLLRILKAVKPSQRKSLSGKAVKPSQRKSLSGKAVKPSQRKSLSGLDDVQASAMTAFDFLCDTVKKLTNDSECVKGLENGKRF